MVTELATSFHKKRYHFRLTTEKLKQHNKKFYIRT